MSSQNQQQTDAESLKALLPQILRLAVTAGKDIIVEYDRLVISGKRGAVTLKADHSPLT